MAPRRNPGAWVFTTVDDTTGLDPVVTVREREGVTTVIRKEHADAGGLPYSYVAGWITLEVRSALDAVGLTAAVSRALADAAISANVVAGMHHDHVFVPHDETDAAVDVLSTLAAGAR
jgi:hypothetical protein